MKFKTNMGGVDRTIRILVGIILLVAGPITNVLDLTTSALIVVGIIGAFALISGTSAFCLFYEIIGSNTLGKKRD